MYHCFTKPNFQSREALLSAISTGETITVFSPGKAKPTDDGVVTVLGPRFPKVRQYYATLRVEAGRVVALAEGEAVSAPEYDGDDDDGEDEE